MRRRIASRHYEKWCREFVRHLPQALRGRVHWDDAQRFYLSGKPAVDAVREYLERRTAA